MCFLSKSEKNWRQKRTFHQLIHMHQTHTHIHSDNDESGGAKMMRSNLFLASLDSTRHRDCGKEWSVVLIRTDSHVCCQIFPTPSPQNWIRALVSMLCLSKRFSTSLQIKQWNRIRPFQTYAHISRKRRKEFLNNRNNNDKNAKSKCNSSPSTSSKERTKFSWGLNVSLRSHYNHNRNSFIQQERKRNENHVNHVRCISFIHGVFPPT